MTEGMYCENCKHADLDSTEDPCNLCEWGGSPETGDLLWESDGKLARPWQSCETCKDRDMSCDSVGPCQGYELDTNDFSCVVVEGLKRRIVQALDGDAGDLATLISTYRSFKREI